MLTDCAEYRLLYRGTLDQHMYKVGVLSAITTHRFRKPSLLHE